MPGQTSYDRALQRFAGDEDTTAHLYLLLGVDYHIYWNRLPPDVAEALLLDSTREHTERFNGDEVDWCATNNRAGLVPWVHLLDHMLDRLRPTSLRRSMNHHGGTIVDQFTTAIETSGRAEEMWQLVNTYADTHTGSTAALLATCADICGATIVDANFTEHRDLPTVVHMTRRN